MGKRWPNVTKLPISAGELDFLGRGANREGFSESDNGLDFPFDFVLILMHVKSRRRVTEFQVNGQR